MRKTGLQIGLISVVLKNHPVYPDLSQAVYFRIPVFNSRTIYPYSLSFNNANYYRSNRPLFRITKLAIEDPYFFNLDFIL